MNKIIMLGNGMGVTSDLYNTCFVIQNREGVFLVDTGGSIEIVKRLQECKISLNQIKHIFISHSHMDHIFGLIWMFKLMRGMIKSGEKKEKLVVYCNEVVYEAIQKVVESVLYIGKSVIMNDIADFVILKSEDKYNINGVEYTFFDIEAKGTKQFGFECMLNDNKLVFLGDETINPNLYDRVRGSDYVMHEAFCLDREEEIFHAYEKHHSTALSAARTMNALEIKNLILYHTEESHEEMRKKLYTEEAKSVFDGNVIVPDDLEEIVLERKMEL